jgi:hypothetical protein
MDCQICEVPAGAVSARPGRRDRAGLDASDAAL